MKDPRLEDPRRSLRRATTLASTTRCCIDQLNSPKYTSLRFTEHLALEGIRPSIGAVGDAYDNALMESINGLYKAECIRTTVSTAGPTRPSPTSSKPPPAGPTGTTTGACTALWG